jgi:flagellar basal-body rod modification protein FlgD
MAIDPTTTATTPPVLSVVEPAKSATAKSATAKAATEPQTLGKDDFLKLMVAQMKNQDPMNPADDKDNIAQMAQFSSLEQITNLANATQQLADRLSLTQNVGLLGHTVTYTGIDGASASGTVDGLDLDKDGTATLTVGGRTGVDPTAVTSVR